jgi:hypothetical protein
MSQSGGRFWRGLATAGESLWRAAVPWLRPLISLLLLFLLVRRVNAVRLLDLWTTVDLRLLAFAVVLLLASPLTSAPRWQAILARLGYPMPIGPLTRALYIGAFFSQILPSSVGGDVWRVWACTRDGMPLGTATHSVLIDRIAGLAVTLVCFIVTIPWLMAKVGTDPVRWPLWGLLAACLGGIAFIIVLGARARSLARVSLLAPLSRFADALYSIGRSATLVAFMFATAVTGQLVSYVAFFALARSIGAPLSFIDCLVTMPPALLIALVPISLGGWGLREGAFVVILKFYGIPAEQALLLSILFGLALLISTLPGLALWLMQPVSPRLQRPDDVPRERNAN